MAQFDQAAKNTGVEVMSAEEMLKDTYELPFRNTKKS